MVGELAEAGKGLGTRRATGHPPLEGEGRSPQRSGGDRGGV